MNKKVREKTMRSEVLAVVGELEEDICEYYGKKVI